MSKSKKDDGEIIKDMYDVAAYKNKKSAPKQPVTSGDLKKPDQPQELSNIKRMISTLDKFLSRRIAGIAGFYIASMIVLGSVLITKGVVTNAYAGDEAPSGLGTTEVVIYSLASVFTFLFALVIARFVAVKIRREKAKKMSNNG